MLQGFLLSRPGSLDEIERLVGAAGGKRGVPAPRSGSGLTVQLN
jgi:hypothetical protein